MNVKQNNKSDNNRSRLLLLLKHLYKNSDDNHVASVAELSACLRKMALIVIETSSETM